MPKDLQDGKDLSLSGGLALEAARMSGQTLSGLDAKGVTLEAVVFDKVELSSCTLKLCSMQDVIATDCLFFGSNFDGSGWRRVALNGGMHSGIALTDCSLDDVVFDGCKLNLSNFRMAKLARVTFRNCDLTGADFQGAVLRDVVFLNCNMAGVDFSNITAHCMDLRTSDISGLKGIRSLKGAIISTSQLISLAPNMAADLGFEVID